MGQRAGKAARKVVGAAKKPRETAKKAAPARRPLTPQRPAAAKQGAQRKSKA